MADNTPKEPPIQTMSGMPPNHNPWMYGLYSQYNGYHGHNMYPPSFYNHHQYFPHMGNGGPFATNEMHQFRPHNEPAHPFSKPPPPAPLLGMSPIDTTRPFFNQSPIRFNLNGNRKSTPIPPNENPLLGNGGKKKRKKGNNNDDNASTLMPPLPDYPPPLPPCPPPDIPKPPPPPPPLDVPLPPPIATEDIPEPPSPMPEEAKNDDVKENALVPPVSDCSTNFLNSTSICQTSAGTWPESLERYIKRCYEKCKTGFDRDQIDICLKGRITAAANKDEIWTRNWDEEPIPSVHSERNNLSVKPLRGTLSLYQKCENVADSSKSKSLSNRSYNGHKNSPQRRRRQPSRSPSRPRSPSKKRHSTSSASGEDCEDKKGFKSKNKQKVKDRLSLDQKKPEKFLKNNKKKPYGHFNIEDVPGNAEKLQKRAARFANVPSIASSIQIHNDRIEPSQSSPVIQDFDGDYEPNNEHIVGTCPEIEKSFLRLTKAPEACEVRPASVLINSLRNVKERWIVKQDYRYACDQLKSIRQDLTVQGIRDRFTVEVYETHARIALEKGDHEEFNQCQTQLKMLYAELPDSRSNSAEFTAYRILYYIFTKNSLDIIGIFRHLSKEERLNDCIKHALKTRHAWATRNLHKFFILYKVAPLMAGYLIDWFVERERKDYLKCILKSYRQTVPVDFITRELAFESSSKTTEFLNQFSVSYADSNQTLVDCKASLPVVANI
ncbi:leukocyte receptor cluster member 8 isoform X2 [Epargyreus clarus]|uniref:leukocyte receptor cluster member 8 isoform X2 n=1 Tax=Epargyreus clarus TaxID=520877 RepID=UPI003C2F77FD